jgi:hypothetical protein
MLRSPQAGFVVFGVSLDAVKKKIAESAAGHGQ